MISSVRHPKGNRRPAAAEEGVRVTPPQEILGADLRASMHRRRRFLIAKPQAIQQQQQHVKATPQEELKEASVCCHKKTPDPGYSHLSLCFTREERRHLVKDFRDDVMRSLCVDACLHASPADNPLPAVHQELAIEDMNKYLVTVSEETRSAMLRVLRKMLECFETAGDKVGGLPSEVSIAVVMWLKQLLEDMFDEVTPASSFGSFAATTSDEDEEEKEEFVALRYANKDWVPTSVNNLANVIPDVLDVCFVQYETNNNKCVPPPRTTASVASKGHQELFQPSINKQRDESLQTNLVKTSTPIRRGQRKRTRSAVGQEWDRLVALKRQKITVKQSQKSSSSSSSLRHQRKREFGAEEKKASPTRQDDKEEFESQRSFFVKLLFSDPDSPDDDDDDFLHTNTTPPIIRRPQHDITQQHRSTDPDCSTPRELFNNNNNNNKVYPKTEDPPFAEQETS